MRSFRGILSCAVLLAAYSTVSAEATAEVGEEELQPVEKLPADVVVLTEATFEHQTQVATGATTGDWFVEFYAPWCGHCKKLEPVWKALAQELSGEANVAKVDVTANRGLGSRFGIKGYPTLIFFHHGEMYRYQGKRLLESLAEFARGGFKNAAVAATPVPPDSTMLTRLKGVADTFLKDVAALPKGKRPANSSIFAFVGGLLLLVMVSGAIGLIASGPGKPKQS